jgi:hypothetical protein
MMTGEERLKFVVQFAGMDLDRLRPGDRLNLLDDLGDFLTNDIVIVDGLPPQKFRAGELRDLQREVKRVLTEMVAKRELPGNHLPLANFIPLIELEDATLGITPLDSLNMPGRNLFRVKLPVRGAFFLTLGVLLWQEPTHRILQCPECNTIFYRVRNQQYCGRTCVNRANKRAWRVVNQPPSGRPRGRPRKQQPQEPVPQAEPAVT